MTVKAERNRCAFCQTPLPIGGLVKVGAQEFCRYCITSPVIKSGLWSKDWHRLLAHMSRVANILDAAVQERDRAELDVLLDAEILWREPDPLTYTLKVLTAPPHIGITAGIRQEFEQQFDPAFLAMARFIRAKLRERMPTLHWMTWEEWPSERSGADVESDPA